MRTSRLSSAYRGQADNRVIVGLTVATLMVVAIWFTYGGKETRDRVVVTGQVTYRGEPLRFGTVVFEPEAGQYATGAIQPDGTFQMETFGEGEGVPIGTNKVRFVCYAGQDPAAKRAVPRGEGLALGDPLIPRKYLSSDTSGIVVELKPGDRQHLVFTLDDD
jgi:hypothetical protein